MSDVPLPPGVEEVRAPGRAMAPGSGGRAPGVAAGLRLAHGLLRVVQRYDARVTGFPAPSATPPAAADEEERGGDR